MNVLLELLKYLSGPVVIIITILILLIKYPEKVEKWISLLLRLFYFITKKGERTLIAFDIQGRIT